MKMFVKIATILVVLTLLLIYLSDYSNVTTSSLKVYGMKLFAWPSEAATCEKPVESLVFLKNHKCASTTVERIFLRYGKKRGLSFVLPPKGNQIGVPVKFKTDLMSSATRSPNNKYNFYVLHSRLNVNEIKKVIYDDAVWVTILRDPLKQFESMWDYYDLEKKFKMPIEKFVQLDYRTAWKKRKYGIWGIHQMFFDLGYGEFDLKNESSILKEIKNLDKTFHLVMITENMDESLILLRHLMCWSIEDVAYVSINSRMKSKSNNLSTTTKSKLAQLNKPDVMLYNYFTNAFKEKVRAFGTVRMQEELKDLKMACEDLQKRCIGDVVHAKGLKGFEHENEHIFTYKAKNASQECFDLLRFQPTFIDEIRNRQKIWMRHKWTIPLKDIRD